MAFNQELEDFASGFSKGYDMVESKDERAQNKARTRYMEAQSTLLESQTTPEALAAAADRLDIEIDTARQNLIDLKDPVLRERAARDAESLIDARNATRKLQDLQYQYESDPKNIELKRARDEAALKLDQLKIENEGRTGKLTDLQLKEAERTDKLHDAMFNAISGRLSPGSQPLTEAVPAGPTGGGTVPAGPAAGGGGVTFEPPAPTAVDVPLEDREGVGDVPVLRGPEEAVPSGTDEPLAYTAEEPPRERYGLSPGELEGSDMTPAQQAIENLLNGNLTSSKDKKNAIIDGAKEGTKAGLNYLAEQNGLNQDHAVDTPETEQQQEDFLSGAQGADSETAQMVMDMTNQAAGGDLSIDEQATYALGTGYLYYLAIGEPEKAAKFAAGMVGFNQRLASQYSVFGQAAAANGDISAANEAIMRAYAHVTNGESLHITPTEDGRFTATITDMKTGKTRHEQIMTPDEIGAMASGVTADSYVKLMSQAAGIDDKTISDQAAVNIGLSMGIKDPEMAIKILGGMTAPEINSLLSSEKNKGAAGAAASKAAAEDREKRLVKPIDMGKIEEDVTKEIDRIMEKNAPKEGEVEGPFGVPGTTYNDQDMLKAEGHMVDYSEDVKSVAIDLMTNPENYGRAIGATEAVRIARSLAEKRPDDLVIDPKNDQLIRIFVKGHPAGLTMDRQRYNDIGLVRSFREDMQNKDTKQPPPASAPPEVVGSPGSAALETEGAVDAGPGAPAAPAVHPRVGAGGGQSKPLPIPGGPSRLEGPSRAGMPRPPSERPRSRSDYPRATPVPAPIPAPAPPLAPSSRKGGGSLLNDEIQQLFQ